ncbi:MAG: 3'-5' exonuclease, partial [Eggerthellaceae bacterium]|nr:3'-5' exonuclease [Eggerthellaceae bacterium]
MNLSEAIGHASTVFIPEFLFGMDEEMLEGERTVNEEALHLLIEEYFANPNPSFDFELVLDLADRNRSISDMMPPETAGGDRSRSRNLPSGLSDVDIVRGIAALQHRRVETLEKEIAGMNATRGVLYGSKPAKGTFVGVDIETTSNSPDRGYIVNIGWETMKLAEGAEAQDPESHFCGIPDQYAQTGVPLAEVHGIEWSDVAGEKPFR